MKIYTKKGDKGKTSLIGELTTKDDFRVDAYGTVDTLNSHLNYVMSLSNEYDEYLVRISNYLFHIGHDLSQTDSTKYKVDEKEIEWLEINIDYFTDKIGDFDHFILPGGTQVASYLHICRTICRTCERKIVKASKYHQINDNVLTYINRLSDFIYMLACYENYNSKVPLRKVQF